MICMREALGLGPEPPLITQTWRVWDDQSGGPADGETAGTEETRPASPFGDAWSAEQLAIDHLEACCTADGVPGLDHDRTVYVQGEDGRVYRFAAQAEARIHYAVAPIAGDATVAA